MNASTKKSLNILGCRGIPTFHGGFETFAAHLSFFMRDAGWNVTVYCQEDHIANKPSYWEDDWEGIHRVHFRTRLPAALSTIEFDIKCILHVLKRPGVDLVLGYNTAIFNVIQRLFGRKVFMNMDGIEWKRKKWGPLIKTWFWFNEWIGAHTCSVPIADHPEIAAHLAARGCHRTIMISYGADMIKEASYKILANYSLAPQHYFISICRIEPENSILEIVQAFCKANTGLKLVIVGKLDQNKNPYHRKVKTAANADVVFPGAIYETPVVNTLRFYCRAYLHGHQVGGTNPSLVAALGAGNPIIAQDNKFNRWTAGSEQLFFKNVDECAKLIQLVSDPQYSTSAMQHQSRIQHQKYFLYEYTHQKYLAVLSGHPS